MSINSGYAGFVDTYYKEDVDWDVVFRFQRTRYVEMP